jgi:hypothetical protein
LKDRVEGNQIDFRARCEYRTLGFAAPSLRTWITRCRVEELGKFSRLTHQLRKAYTFGFFLQSPFGQGIRLFRSPNEKRATNSKENNPSVPIFIDEEVFLQPWFV